MAGNFQEGLKSLLKDKITSDALLCVDSSELDHIAVSPLEVMLEKVSNNLDEHCVLVTGGELSQFILIGD